MAWVPSGSRDALLIIEHLHFIPAFYCVYDIVVEVNALMHTYLHGGATRLALKYLNESKRTHAVS